MPESDRRAAERFPVTANTTCEFAAPLGEDLGPTRIKNVSTNGIGLLVSRPVQPGTMLTVAVVNKSKSFSKIMLVQVVHVTPSQGGTYLVGGQFVTPLTYQELTSLVM
jgi:hypothetical protein